MKMQNEWIVDTDNEKSYSLRLPHLRDRNVASTPEIPMIMRLAIASATPQ